MKLNSLNSRLSISNCITAIFLLLALFVGTAYATTEPKRQSSKGADKQFVVVIDAGHGGHDHGAIDNGVREKDINLGVAKKLAAMIKKKMKNVKVVMTRDDDTFISLQERANIANRNKGNLFISIHTNSVDKSNPNRKSVSGTSVYALGPQKDANNLKVAMRENSVIELEDDYHQKYSGFDPSKDESYIIFEMAQKKNLGQSLRFAEKAQKELVNTAGRKDRGVKQAGFWVLWATAMPSVLVELDFICNPTEAKFLGSEAGQTKFADALFKAVESYVKGTKTTAANYTPAVTETSVTESDMQVAADNEVRTLASGGNSTERAQRKTGVAPAVNRRGSGPRRRRSDSSRQISENQSHETDNITLLNENRYMAVSDVKEDPKPAEPTDEQTTDSKSKKKKNKKDKKDKKKNNKKDNKKSSAKDSGNKQPKTKTEVADNSSAKSGKAVKTQGGKKTFVVRNNNGKLTARRQSGNGSDAAQTAANAMKYTIVLVSSDTELAQDDPAFGKIVPTGVFKENGKYHYTYGSGTDRREMEEQLLRIKSILPQATIVVRME